MKKIYIAPVFSFKLELFIMLIALFLLIYQKLNSVIIPFSRNNSNIIKIHNLFALNHDNHCKDMAHSYSYYLKNATNGKYHTL